MLNKDKKPMEKKHKIIVFSILAVLIALLAVGIGIFAVSGVFGRISQGELAKRLAAEGSDTIVIKGTIKIDETLVVNGDKTITGNGDIVLREKLAGEWPEEEKKNSWGMGCASLDLAETEGMSAMLKVSDGAILSLGKSVTLNASGNGNAICVTDGGKLTLTDKAEVQEGRYANVVVTEKATAELQGGSVKDSKVYGVINYGTLDISGGNHTGSEAVIYNVGTATQSDGVVAEATAHNVYVAKGTFTMTGGTNEGASKDGVIVQEGASADVKGGDIKTCVHGLCNSGKLNSEKVALSECGIMNYKTGELTINGTTVDTAATYCLANNGGKVKAKNFTAKKCDTCAVYNFSGDMNLTDLTVSGSRDGNIGNGGGNLTVNGAKLEKCRDKSITVGNGKAVFNNVAIEGTSREKYGVYVYGGECYMTEGTLSDISSTAFKVDAGGYMDIKNITVKNTTENLFHADGGKIKAEGVTAEGIGSHAVYNMQGDIAVTNATLKTITKNVIQQKGGTTTLEKINADAIGNNGAYVELGSVTVKESIFKNMTGNGFYIVEGENDTTLTNMTLDGVGKQGINNASKVTINGLTVKNTTQNGIYNKGKGTLTAQNVTVSNTGEHGINNASTMTVAQVTISNTGKKSNGLQNKGTLTINGVTVENSRNHGAYNEGTMTGSNLTMKGVAQNGVYNAKGTFSVSKVNVDGTGGHGFNNAAKMIVSDVTVLNATQNGIFNAEKGILQVDKSLVVNGAGSHGINNKGSFIAAESTNTIVKNIVGKNCNAINNNKGNMTLGNVTIDNIQVTIAMYDNEKINSNSGNAVFTNNALQLNGNAVISNVYSLPVDNKTDNTNSSGVVVKGGGSITGKGSITVSGNGIKEIAGKTYQGVYNGVYTSESIIDIDGDITVNTAYHQGIYVGGANAKVDAGNITISDIGVGNGVYISDVSGTLNASGTITISNTGQRGIANTKGGVVKATAISVSNTTQEGISNDGTIKAATIFVERAGTIGIVNKGIIGGNGKGTVAVDMQNMGTYGIHNNKGNIHVASVTVKNTKDNGIFMENEAVLQATKVYVEATKGQAIQLNHANTLKVGTLQIINSAKNGLRLYNNNADPSVVIKTVIARDCEEQAIAAQKQITDANISISEVWYKNCGKGAVHGNIKSGVAEPIEIAK